MFFVNSDQIGHQIISGDDLEFIQRLNATRFIFFLFFVLVFSRTLHPINKKKKKKKKKVCLTFALSHKFIDILFYSVLHSI